ncbi:RWD domain-containing protein 1 isoform X3 [Calonectris borealis]|uniref:RWD domain-containing protein 1 isoform X3 n=1 Tax=Calonectris borealis TaxID=1323832 RepID=UPI003F4C6837
MTDYSEEQRNELEALESIYPDSFTGEPRRGPWRGGGKAKALDGASRHGPGGWRGRCLPRRRLAPRYGSPAWTPVPVPDPEPWLVEGCSLEKPVKRCGPRWKLGNWLVCRPVFLSVLSEKPTTFTITVTSEAGENDETVQTTLKFTYREKYPDETPLYEIVSQENLDDNDVTDIIKLLEQQQRFHGTPVTIENFLNWKAKFDAELLEIKRKKMKEEEQAGKNKLSGKQLFEMDHNLDTSDIQFLEEAGNSVEVDESLFQEMDDLELEDEEDDPDYNPVNLDSD